MKKQIKIYAVFFVLLAPNLLFAGDGGTTTSTTPTTTGVTSVSGALGEAKKQNTLGVVASIAGAGLHGAEAYGYYAKFFSTCPSCNYPALGMALLHTAAMASSYSQASAHSASNQALIPDLCKTSAGVCNTSAYAWPDMSGCNNNPTCINNAINNSGNTDLSNLYNPTDPNNPFNQVSNLNNELIKNGGSYDPSTGLLKINGQTYDTKKLLTDANARKAAGITDADLKKFQDAKNNIDKTTAGLASDGAVAAAMNSGLGGSGSAGGLGSGTGASKTGIDPLTGQAYGVNLDSLGSTAEGGASAEMTAAEAEAAARAGLYGRGGKGLKDGSRVPASIAGKKRMFNGEPIGVAGDSIFDMMTRRYQVKQSQNTFLDPALVDPK